MEISTMRERTQLQGHHPLKQKQPSLNNAPSLNSFHKGELQGIRKSSCHRGRLCEGKHHDVKESYVGFFFPRCFKQLFLHIHAHFNTHGALLIVFHSNMHSLALNYL